MGIDALQIKEVDNVATSLRDIRVGEEAVVGVMDTTIRILIREEIPYGHKFAIRQIARGNVVVKYGETIGRATSDIPSGANAHIQNIESLRGRGDWKEKGASGGI